MTGHQKYFSYIPSDLLQAGVPLVEIDNSTVCLPLLYSAMIHSTSTKAQKDISLNDCFQILFFMMKLFHFCKCQQEATVFCHGAMSLILALQ